MAEQQQFSGLSQSIYELIVQHAPLDVVLSAITTVMEEELPGALVSVMLYSTETGKLDMVAGSSFSEAYKAEMQGISIGPFKGACGAAAHNRELTVCEDIASDRRWNGFHTITSEERLAACWSTPLVKNNGQLLGTFATYYREKRRPTDDEIQLIRRAAGLVVLAITHQENERLLNQYSTHDLLTGLPNRALFEAHLSYACQQEGQGAPVSVIHVDLDDFKPVNNTLGYAIGDRLLKTMAERLQKTIGDRGLVARLGADEFAVLLTGPESPPQITRCADEILHDLSRPFEIEGNQLHISASVGIASQHSRPMRAEELMCYADAAVQDAKAEGRNTWHWFEGLSPTINSEYVTMRRELMEAIEQQQFEVHYQPIIAATSGRIRGVEALVRWRHPSRGLIAPGQFIPLAEQTGQIVAIGQWVLQRACADIATWNRQHSQELTVFVNISPLQFRRYGFLQEIQRALEESQLAPELLELEVTENVLMSGTGRAIETLGEIRDMGVRVAIDDFGTGYSSLRYLRELPINKVKVDRSFITDITDNSGNAAIVQGIITMAHHLGLRVVGEGVETPEQAQDLEQRGCDFLQGFLFYRPMPLSDLDPAIASGKRHAR